MSYNDGYVQQKPMLSFGQAVRSVLNKYATFSGRSRRSEYWWFVVFNLIVSVVAIILDSVLGTNAGSLPYGLFYVVASLGLIIPHLAVLVRRLHDINKSGWNFFWSLIPLVGTILLLVWFCKDSDRGANQYGESPKYV